MNQKNNSKKNTIIIIVVAVLLILAVAGGTVFFIFTALNSEEATPTLASSALSSEESSAPSSRVTISNDGLQLPVATSSSLPSGVYFFEDFSNRLKAADGWNKDASVSAGRYAGGGVVLTGFSAVSNLKDYAVEAEISINMIASTNVNLNVAAILGRYVSNESGEGGFEVGIATSTKDGSNHVRVYDRLKKKEVCTFECQPIESGKTYKLTAVFSGSNLLVFIDGVCIGKTTVENRAGAVGINRGGYTAYYDNFRVRKATSAEKSAKPASPSQLGGTVSTDTSGLPDGVYFMADFEKSIKTSDGWNINADVTSGQYTGKALALTRNASISAMKDYAVEAEVFINTGGTTTAGSNVAAISGRYAKVGEATGGIEVGLLIPTEGGKGHIRVYDRVNKKQLAAFTSTPIYGSQYYKITAVFSGATLAVFLDDNFVGKVTVDNRAGTVGLSSNGYPAYFDNYVVRKATSEELSAAGIK